MEKARNQIAVYPGTFDPLTNGHVSLIRRGLQIFDTIIVAVAKDTPKVPLFSLEERVAMTKEAFVGESRLVVQDFSGLLVDFVRAQGASVILRGMRAISDFEYEFQMALMNRKLNSDVHTVFLMTDFKWLYISSTIIKEAAKYGGDVQGLVPDVVLERLRQKLQRS